MSIFSNICIGLLAAGTIAIMLGLIGMGIADRKERKTAERLEDERKNGGTDVLPEINNQSQGEYNPKQSQEPAEGQTVRIKIFDKIAPRKIVYRDDCKYCRYDGYNCEPSSCQSCDNSEVNIDGEPSICHCFDILKVESKRPQCPYFKDKIEG
jgi:hypothetical protein